MSIPHRMKGYGAVIVRSKCVGEWIIGQVAGTDHIAGRKLRSLHSLLASRNRDSLLLKQVLDLQNDFLRRLRAFQP